VKKLASMVLPLEGGGDLLPSAVMVIVFSDAAMLIYGDFAEDGFFKVDMGRARCFAFSQYPALRELRQKDGTIHLAKFWALIPMERWL
jgi:hypothetical protein